MAKNNLGWCGLLLVAFGCGSPDLVTTAEKGKGGATDPANVSEVPEFVRTNAGAAHDAHLALRIWFNPQHVFEFYEPSPGNIMFSEAAVPPEGPYPLPPQLQADRCRNVVELYRALMPGSEVPEVIEKLEARRAGQAPTEEPSRDLSNVPREDEPFVTVWAPSYNEQVTAQEPVVGTVPSGELGPKTQAATRGGNSSGLCSRSWFESQPGFCPGGAYHQWCLRDWWDGAFEGGPTRTDETVGTVCPRIGNVSMQVSGTGGSAFFNVPEATWRQWSNGCHRSCLCLPLCINCCDFTTRYDITNAFDSNFQFGGAMWRHD
ncbi:MAG TPA: hypothetical protein VER96_10250 [Polyangiaceae bacterium]|nr:hypothetical protein [Polyangiaceae bacterium]